MIVWILSIHVWSHALSHHVGATLLDVIAPFAIREELPKGLEYETGAFVLIIYPRTSTYV